MRTQKTITLAGSAVALALVAVNTSDCRAEPAGETEDTMLAKQDYGFRYDPMEWVNKSDSFEAAVARYELFACHKPGDAERIRKHLDEAFPESMERARQGRMPGACWFASRTAMPQTKKLADAMLAAKREQGQELTVYPLQLMSLAGRTDDPLARRSAQKLAAEIVRLNIWHTCQSGPFEWLQALSGFGDVAGVAEAMAHIMSPIEKHINAAGFTGKGLIPYAQVWVTRYLDHPVIARMLRKTLPFVLTAQAADGGWRSPWGDETLNVLVSLKKAGLFDELRKTPPKPADWRVVRTISAPKGKVEGLTWDGKRFWVRQPEGNRAIAVSPRDGSVLKTLPLPGKEVRDLAWWNGKLHVAQWAPKKLLVTIDPETAKVVSSFPLTRVEVCGAIGLVDGKIWAVDNRNFVIAGYRADGGGLVGHFPHPTGNTPKCFTVLEGSVWHAEWCGPVMIQTGFDGTLLDFAAGPFPGAFYGLDDLAWDGKHLWALDGEANRICQIERTEEGKAFAQRFIRGGE